MTGVRPARVALIALCAVIALWLIAPTLVVIPMSFTEAKSFGFPPKGFTTEWYSNFFSNPEWYDALVTSLQVAVLVTVVAGRRPRSLSSVGASPARASSARSCWRR